MIAELLFKVAVVPVTETALDVTDAPVVQVVEFVHSYSSAFVTPAASELYIVASK